MLSITQQLFQISLLFKLDFRFSHLFKQIQTSEYNYTISRITTWSRFCDQNRWVDSRLSNSAQPQRSLSTFMSSNSKWFNQTCMCIKLATNLWDPEKFYVVWGCNFMFNWLDSWKFFLFFLLCLLFIILYMT